ncbi:RDD family protein [Phenylobacterium sp.]|uniref:RDD family protein n=1 Tax=Phenylobacterium sp. TaxID=1871053 RepID=UPI00286E37B1|nr:RDD family protein [Phenylobacterium sp.]
MTAKDTWFYRDGDVELGPTKAADLTALVRKGMVAGATPVRRAADTVWTTAAQALPWLFTVPEAQPGVQSGWTDTAPHAWRRYFARSVDNMIVGSLTWALIGMVAYAIAPAEADAFFKIFDGPGGQIIDILLTLLAAIPGNALIIGLTGLSIGKWIFGIRVLKDGAPIGVMRALRREFAVWFQGLGCGIPLVSLATLLTARGRLEDQGVTTWDKAQQLTVNHRPESRLATILMWTAGLLYFAWLTALRAFASL